MSPYEVLMNVISNLVLHKSLKFNYKHPPCMNRKISYSLRKRAELNLQKLFRFIEGTAYE